VGALKQTCPAACTEPRRQLKAKPRDEAALSSEAGEACNWPPQFHKIRQFLRTVLAKDMAAKNYGTGCHTGSGGKLRVLAGTLKPFFTGIRRLVHRNAPMR